MVFNNNLLLGAAGAAGGYTIEQSIRFDKTTSSHLSKTYGSAGNRRTWTFSTWFKRGKIDASRQILFAATGQAYLQLGPDAASREMITILNEGTGTDLNWYTTAVYRDPSAWYHLVWQFDSTQATADDRTKLYINGVQVTDFTKAATPDQNFDGAVNNNVEHKIGEGHIANYYFDGYQAEIHFIDGTALDASSFGETNGNGVWVPKAYTGSYGTNGFYITGADSADLGADDSGNSNDFTSSGLTSADQMLDTPTDNFCTLNPLSNYNSLTISDGNLTASASGYGLYSTLPCDASGVSKVYFEYTAGTMSGGVQVGVASPSSTSYTGSAYPGGASESWAYKEDGQKQTNATLSSYGSSWTTNDIIGVAVDTENNAIWFSKNGTWQASATAAEIAAGNTTNAAFTGLTDTVFLGFGTAAGAAFSGTFNFGQSAFTYTPPTGFNALSTANLTDTTITTSGSFTGNGSTDGPFVWLNGVPTTMTINGNSVTFATDADKLANGFKVRSSSASYNAVGSNTYSISSTGNAFKNANAQENP